MKINLPCIPRRLLLLVYLTGVAGVQAALAGPAAAKVSCDKDKECARLAAKAREFSQAGRFEAAKQAYLSAYARRSDAQLLYNLARVLHKAGHPADAAVYYRRYLEAGAEGSDEQRKKAETFLQQATAEAAPASPPRSLPDRTVNSQPQPLPSPVVQPQPLPSPVVQPQPLPSPVVQPQPLPSPVVQPQPAFSQDLVPRRPRWRFIVGGAALGTGLLFLGFGTSALLARGMCVAAPVAPAQACGYLFTTDGIGGGLVGTGAALTLSGVILMAWPP